MGSYWSVGLAGLLLVGGLASSGAEKPRKPYRLDVRPLSKGGARLRLVHQRSGRSLWTRTAYDIQRIRWSRSGRALAIVEDQRPRVQNYWPRWRYNILVWREGRRLRVFKGIPPDPFESVHHVFWSPDETRLLLIGPHTMGSAEAGRLTVWGLTLATERVKKLFEGAHRTEWVTNETIRVWGSKEVSDPGNRSKSVWVEFAKTIKWPR